MHIVINAPGEPAAQTVELGVGEYVNVRAEDGHEVTALLPDSEFICIWHPERDPSVHRPSAGLPQRSHGIALQPALSP